MGGIARVTGRDIVGGIATGYRPGYCGRYSDWLQVGILWVV